VNRRIARREALWRVAGLLRGELAEGWPPPELYPDDATRDRVVEELNVVLAELERRGHPAWPGGLPLTGDGTITP
jgi:hypothetical protein